MFKATFIGQVLQFFCILDSRSFGKRSPTTQRQKTATFRVTCILDGKKYLAIFATSEADKARKSSPEVLGFGRVSIFPIHLFPCQQLNGGQFLPQMDL